MGSRGLQDDRQCTANDMDRVDPFDMDAGYDLDANQPPSQVGDSISPDNTARLGGNVDTHRTVWIINY